MPRPTLRRTVSSPAVRQRASSNPYPPMSPITSRSMASAMLAPSGSSSSLSSAAAISGSIVTRSRRVNSTSAGSSSSSVPPPPPPSASDYWSRRVLQDITWCYHNDGQQLTIVSSADTETTEDNMAGMATTAMTDAGEHNIIDDLEDMERLSLGASGAPPTSIVEEDEEITIDGGDADILLCNEELQSSNDPFALLTNTDSQPSSTNSSPARPSVGRRSISLGNDRPLLHHSRRESSFSSISTSSDFEDFMVSPSYL